jgi:CheY-like chemotaxis protein
MGSTVDDLRVGRCESTAHKTLVVALGREQGFHSLLRAVIDELGYQCYAEHLQPATVQHVARLRPAAILVDVDFGHERQAWAVIQELRADPGTTDIPVVVCAAAAWLLDEHRKFLEDNDVLSWSEPFDIAELVRTLNAVLNGRPGRIEEDLTGERAPDGHEAVDAN